MAQGSQAAIVNELLVRIASHTALAELHPEHQLSSSPTGNRWLLNSNQGRLVLTLDTPFARVLGIDRQYQFHLLNSLAAHRIAPEPVFYDAELGCLLVTYLEGSSFDKSTDLGKHQLAEFAELFRVLHTAEANTIPGGPAASFQARITAYGDFACSSRAESLVGDIRRQVDSARGVPAGLCHNDAHIKNLISGNKVGLIDWDYAGEGLIWFDLVTFLYGCGLTGKAADYFLDAYFGARSAWTRGELEDWLEIRDCVDELWQLCVASQISCNSPA